MNRIEPEMSARIKEISNDNEQLLRRSEAAAHMVMYCLAFAVAVWLLLGHLGVCGGVLC